jgi:hypothetical protein
MISYTNDYIGTQQMVVNPILDLPVTVPVPKPPIRFPPSYIPIVPCAPPMPPDGSDSDDESKKKVKFQHPIVDNEVFVQPDPFLDRCTSIFYKLAFFCRSRF